MPEEKSNDQILLYKNKSATTCRAADMKTASQIAQSLALLVIADICALYLSGVNDEGSEIQFYSENP